ncbi:MAG: outer membrane protein transport protein [Bacteroidota bacterium]
MKFKVPFLLLFATLLSVVSAIAGGFTVGQQSARNIGLGNSGLVSLGEPVLLHQNPALIAFLPGTVFSFGTTVSMPDTRFTPDGGNEIKMVSQAQFPPNVTLTHNFDGFSVGISGAIPFAMNSEWGETWAGASQTVRSDFRVVYASPGVAFRLGSRFAVGVAVNIGFPKLQMSHRFTVSGTPSATGLESFDAAGSAAFGGSVGLLFRPNKNVTFGLTYMSRMKLDIDKGTVSYSELPDSLATKFQQTTASLGLKTPDIAGAGLALHPLGGVSLEANVEYTFWSALKSVSIRYPQEALIADPSLRSSIPLNWKNSWTFHCGLEIALEDVVLRAGYVYDQTPIPDNTFVPFLPDADKRSISVGLGYFVSEGLRLDFAYQYLRFLDRAVGAGDPSMPAGVYSTTWSILGINVSYFWN